MTSATRATVTAVTPPRHGTAGTVTALAAVTGVRDLVGDVIEPGAFADADPRRVRMHARHRWDDEIGTVTGLIELLPGDPRLPARTAAGRPWPTRAGGLWVRGRFALDTAVGRAAHREAKALGTAGRWSIGYVGRNPRRVGDTRYLPGVSLIEVSLVDNPANPLAQTIEVKARGGGRVRLEVKAAPWLADEPALLSGGVEIDEFDLLRQRRLALVDVGVVDEQGPANTVRMLAQLPDAHRRHLLGRLVAEHDAETFAVILRAARRHRASLAAEAGEPDKDVESWEQVLAQDVRYVMGANGDLARLDERGDGWAAQAPRWP